MIKQQTFSEFGPASLGAASNLRFFTISMLLFGYLLSACLLSASGRSITSDVKNPVVEIGKNILIHWNINRVSDGSSIKFISIYCNNNLNEKKQIVASANSMLFITSFAKDFYGDRLQTDFVDNQITLNIANTKYKDSGNYLIEVELKTKEDANAAVTLKVHGNFFQLLLVIIVFMEFL